MDEKDLEIARKENKPVMYSVKAPDVIDVEEENRASRRFINEICDKLHELIEFIEDA